MDTSDLLNIRNCGRKTITEINEFLSQLGDFAKDSQEELISEQIPKESEEDMAFRKLSLLSPVTQYELKNWVEKRFVKMSVRARNCVPSFSNIEGVIPVVYSGVGFNCLNIRHCGKKSNVEISSYLVDVKNRFEEIVANVETEPLNSDNENEKQFVLNLDFDTWFLSKEEIESIAYFYKEKGSFPWLFIIQRYLLKKDNLRFSIHRDFYGFVGTSTGASLSLVEIATKHSLSRERVRQLVYEKVPLPSQLSDYVNDELSVKVGNVVSITDPIWERLKEESMIEGSSELIFRLVCSILGGYAIIQFDELCDMFLVKRDLIRDVPLKKRLNEVCRQLHLRRTTITRIDILNIITPDNKTKYHKQATELCELIIDYVTRHYGYKISRGRYIIALPNAVDVGGAIEAILEQQGRPMTIEDLWSEFKTLFPDTTLKSISSLKVHIFRNNNVLPKGNTGVYVLKKWSEHFTGTLTDYLIHVLTELGEPISIDDLTDFAKEQFPKTNRRSVFVLVHSDTQNRFVILENGCVALADGDVPNFRKRKVIQRMSFEERLEILDDFVSSHKRFPIASQYSTDVESALYRWLKNVQSNKSYTKDEQVLQLRQFISKHSNIPQNGTEYQFKQMCDNLKIIVSKTLTLPSYTSKEYIWLRKNIVSYKDYTDNRKVFFEDLLSFLKDYGFYFE